MASPPEIRQVSADRLEQGQRVVGSRKQGHHVVGISGGGHGLARSGKLAMHIPAVGDRRIDRAAMAAKLQRAWPA